MALIKIPKHEVAEELLGRAIDMYLSGNSYISALHLAGAAEEVLSVYARGMSLKPCYDSTKEAILAMATMWPGAENQNNEKAVADLMNEAKNAIKHKRGKGDEWITLDPKYESGVVIDRALSTFLQVKEFLKLKTPKRFMEFHEEYSNPLEE